jgi:zinc protease
MQMKMYYGAVRKMRIVLSIILWFLLFIQVAEAELSKQVFEKVLSNGLKVILLENHKAPVITFQVWYRVGSRNENWGKTGISHMLEHMMFKGTEKVNGSEFARLIQENGGNFNAFTSRDFTAYFENISADRDQVPLGLESDRMHNLVLQEKDFRTERMVVMEERRLRTEDNPKAYLQEQVEATAFQVQPYHWPTIGWMEDIERFTLEDLKAYYSTYYNPANAFLVVIGDFKKEDLLPRIERTFGSIPKTEMPNQKKNIDPPQTGERRIYAKREAQLPFIIMAFHVPNLRDPDSYVLEVIATLLSQGKSSRLYQSLVQEKRLVLDVEADHSLFSHDPALFMVSAEGLPDKEMTKVEMVLDQELDRLRKEPVGEHELQKAKNQLEASFLSGQDSLFFQAMLLAQHEIALDWRAIDNYIPSIRNVGPEDVLRVSNRYLRPENRTIGILLPIPPKEGKSPPTEHSIKTKMIR